MYIYMFVYFVLPKGLFQQIIFLFTPKLYFLRGKKVWLKRLRDFFPKIIKLERVRNFCNIYIYIYIYFNFLFRVLGRRSCVIFKGFFFSQLRFGIKGKLSLTRSLHPSPLRIYWGWTGCRQTHTQTDIATYRLSEKLLGNLPSNFHRLKFELAPALSS